MSGLHSPCRMIVGFFFFGLSSGPLDAFAADGCPNSPFGWDDPSVLCDGADFYDVCTYAGATDTVTCTLVTDEDNPGEGGDITAVWGFDDDDANPWDFCAGHTILTTKPAVCP